jgi:phosphatidylglycerophosphatase A
MWASCFGEASCSGPQRSCENERMSLLAGRHMAVLLASLGGIGFLRPGPGTWGSLATALLAWWVSGGGWVVWLIVGLLISAVGFVASAGALQADGGKADEDPAWIVIDEAAGMWFALMFTPPTLTGWVLAFFFFRLLDIAKPGPVGWADRELGGALGVMADDVIAGLLVAPIVPICIGIAAWLA